MTSLDHNCQTRERRGIVWLKALVWAGVVGVMVLTAGSMIFLFRPQSPVSGAAVRLLHVGMTAEEVDQTLGRGPTRIEERGQVIHREYSAWWACDSLIVSFDANGRMVSIWP